MKFDIEAIIFDCDGTLVDSEIPGMDVMYAMAVEVGLTITREQAYQQFRGTRMATCVSWIASQMLHKQDNFEADFTVKARQAMNARFQQGLAAIPGAEELLGKLKIPFCVATNGPREKVELTLRVAGLRGYFGGNIFSAYELGCFKPDPALFLHAADAMGVQPPQCAVVEDSLPGIQAGVAAGMQVFSLLKASDLPTDLVQGVRPIESLRDLNAYLKN